ncbi:alkaline phosphatase family protein [Caulobacter sp. DWR3-1-2]|uniref:alkaline phosphatase family protein n=1 Tax=Caulobacter sp. DWR3-1-2 TaxID=2804647 RepID=UPI003CF16377
MTIQNIEHIVVLMLENRSFDSMLGWLYEKDSPAAYVPTTTGAPFRGLQAINPNDFVNTALNGKLSVKPTRGVQGFTVPDIAPGEEFDQVLTQFYGTNSPAPGAPVTMKGVLEDFVEVLQKRKVAEADILRLAPMVMQSFTQGQAPVLNQLARHYAVSDAWHASVPSQTNPNRSFLMCGTSNGMINNGDLETDPQAKALEKILGMAIGDDRVDAPTIFNALQTAGVDWNVFYQTSYLPQKISALLEYRTALLALLVVSPLMAAAVAALLVALDPYVKYLMDLTSGELGSCYTWRLFPQIKDKVPNAAQKFQKLDDFHRKARAGQLPKFSYIEPFWSIAHSTTDNPTYENLFSALGNDYHPPGSVLAGEQFVKEVYTSLISNREAWNKTLLLITFDEFVGSFDHQTADMQAGAVQPPWAPNGQPPYKNSAGFKFDRLGARVPTIVISPYVQKGTVFRSSTQTPFDHASVIATTLNAIGRKDLVAQFGARASAAPTFDGVLTLNQPRSDAASLAFLDTPRAAGDLVHYGDTFNLKNQNGQYLSPAYCTMKVAGGGSVIPTSLTEICADLGVAAYFPTLGAQPAPMTFVTSAPDPAAQIANNSQVLLVSREWTSGAHNILGDWADSHDCYYYDEYLDGDNLKKQTWIVQKLANPDQPLRFGDQIHLANLYAQDKRLTRDTRLWQSEWIAIAAEGDYWTVEPAPAQVASNGWNGAPPLAAIAASQQGGSRGAQLWGIDTSGQLRSTFQISAGGPWSGWSEVWNGLSPGQLRSLAAAQQNDGKVRLWAVDVGNVLYSNAQTAPGGNWTGWSPGGWSNPPPLRLIAASQQGGPRGAQLWGVDTSGQLRSTYQETPGGSWSAWSGVWNGASPASLVSLAATQQNDGKVRLWVVDANHLLYSNAQASPGGNWTGWSPGGWSNPPPLRTVAASQQGGARGAQLWGIDTSGQLRSTFQETPGGSWSAWSGVWNGASPPNLVSVAAAQQNDGKVRIWVVDANNVTYSNAQTSPGGNWTGWSPAL